MITETSNKNELLIAIDDAVSSLLDLISHVDESRINIIPYKDSWTAGQLIRHVIKSTGGMKKALDMEGKPAERNPGERIPELKKIFLDFTTKLKSPDAIVPEKGPYEKQAIIEELNESFEQLKKSAGKTNLNEIVEGLPLGSISKLEILHFVLYHTQRHVHQMKKICNALTINNPTPSSQESSI